MTREEEIVELTQRSCSMYRRNEPLERTCAGMKKCDCKCLNYNRCEILYDTGWRKQIEAEWKSNSENFGNTYDYFYCSHCGNYTNERHPYRLGKYCSFCGAKMKERTND